MRGTFHLNFAGLSKYDRKYCASRLRLLVWAKHNGTNNTKPFNELEC